MAIKKVRITQITHTPATGGVFKIYWRCAGDDNATWEYAGDAEVGTSGNLAEDMIIEFDSDDCALGISVQAVSSCNGQTAGKTIYIQEQTTTTSTTTTTTLHCPSMTQILGVGYSGSL